MPTKRVSTENYGEFKMIALEERIRQIMEENETPNTEDNQNTDTQNDTQEDSENNEDEKKDGKEEEEEKEPEFKADSFQDFLDKTETKVKITKVAKEPSPIFGPNDTKEHNKFKVTITNKKGSLYFFYWDSIKNTEANGTPKMEDVMFNFGMDVGGVVDGLSLEDFKEEFGYDETEDSLAQKAYEGCRKMGEKAKNLFEQPQIDELIRLANQS